MTRLPKRYFKSISDYVKTYYTAYGAKRAQKLYDCVKTVTKDFTRTDPVYVRIGEDGEPEIHYTMTADIPYCFKNMNLGSATLCVHNFAKQSTINQFFASTVAKKLIVDALSDSVTDLDGMFANTAYLGTTFYEVGLFDTSRVSNIQTLFQYNYSLKEIPAFDFSAVTETYHAFWACQQLTAFHATGMKVSFDLSSTALKHDAILEVFNNLGTVTAGSGVTLTLGDEKKALMTAEEIKIATDKGWEVA